jgi:hypothetical protein
MRYFDDVLLGMSAVGVGVGEGELGLVLILILILLRVDWISIGDITNTLGLLRLGLLDECLRGSL